MDDVPLRKKSRLEDNSTNSKAKGDVTDMSIPSEGVFFRKASELKPLKRISNSALCKVQDSSVPNITLDRYSLNDRKPSTTCSQLKTNARTFNKGIHQRRGSGDWSPLGSHGNISPGDSVAVKDVANVVVKYLSPYLKQGSIASKVTAVTTVDSY